MKFFYEFFCYYLNNNLCYYVNLVESIEIDCKLFILNIN